MPTLTPRYWFAVERHQHVIGRDGRTYVVAARPDQAHATTYALGEPAWLAQTHPVEPTAQVIVSEPTEAEALTALILADLGAQLIGQIPA